LVDQIRIAVIYKEEFRFLSPDYRDNTLYYFFKHALNRNKRLSTEFFLSGDKFDTKILKNKFDIILLPDNRFPHIPTELEQLDGGFPVLSGEIFDMYHEVSKGAPDNPKRTVD